MASPLRFIIAAVMAALCLAGCDAGNSGNSGLRKKNILSRTTLLATIPDNEKPQAVAPVSAMGVHVPLPASFQPLFSTLGGGVAYSAERGGKVYVIHNGRAGKGYDATGDIALTPDGKRIAYGALSAGRWRMVVDGTEGAPFGAVKAPKFSPDGRHVAYQAMSGDRWYLVVDATPNAGTRTRIIDHQFSYDSGKIAYIDDADDKNRGRLVVGDAAFAKQAIIATGVLSMLANSDESRIAAVAAIDNRRRVIDFSFDRPDSVKTGALYDTVQGLAFGPDGVALAYIAVREGKQLMVIDGKELALAEGVNFGPLVIHPKNKGVGSFVLAGNGVFFAQFPEMSGGAGTGYEAAEGLVYSADGKYHAYAAQKGQSWFVVLNGKEGPAFDRVVTPRFSPDGNFLVYRARKDGKRFVVVADMTGKTIKTHPAYEQVFDVVFTADGKSVAYGVKDGNQLIWKVEKL